jgi:NAD+ synthase (glutamine-hydrolysing)
MVGGQDELVFDGDSLVVAADGTLLARAAQFETELLLVDLDLPDARSEGVDVERVVLSADPLPAWEPEAAPIAERIEDEAEVYGALVLALRDYVRKNGFRSVLLGLSGGIDSSLVAAIACDALSAENVYGVSNPSEYSSEGSRTDAEDLARRTGLNFLTVPIAPYGRHLPGRPAPRRTGRGELAGAGPSGDLDGPVQPARPPGARLRKQE